MVPMKPRKMKMEVLVVILILGVLLLLDLYLVGEIEDDIMSATPFQCYQCSSSVDNVGTL